MGTLGTLGEELAASQGVNNLAASVSFIATGTWTPSASATATYLARLVGGGGGGGADI